MLTSLYNRHQRQAHHASGYQPLTRTDYDGFVPYRKAVRLEDAHIEAGVKVDAQGKPVVASVELRHMPSVTASDEEIISLAQVTVLGFVKAHANSSLPIVIETDDERLALAAMKVCKKNNIDYIPDETLACTRAQAEMTKLWKNAKDIDSAYLFSAKFAQLRNTHK